MKLALLSDIHANRQALEACLLHADAQGVDRHAFLGDLVGYGADPIAVLDQVMALAEQGAIVVQGNHDHMAVQPATTADNMGASTAAWTHQQLTNKHLDFLAHLPMTAQLDHLLLVHASAHQPERWPYIDNARAAQACLQAAMALCGREVAHVLVGHVHHQTLYYKGSGAGLMPFQPSAGVPVPIPASRSCVATVGSVRQPRDGDTRAMYGLRPGARLACVTVISPNDTSSTQSNKSETSVHRSHLNRLKMWAAPLDLAGHQCSMHVLESSDVAGALLAYAHGNHVSMVIMGAATHGLQMQRWVATVPIKVAMDAPCTVVLVKPSLPFELLGDAGPH
jgi:predicted phosphodiesterase/nucleotide-binding universal stress UspA family protein